jgi:tetrapyrrole methylase family protein/MazG family protein
MTALDASGRSFEALLGIVAQLRSPNGCPWDKEQSHLSLRGNLLEECYEALEALDKQDLPSLTEELGDVMVQVAFHCQIAAEYGEFTQEDVFRSVIQKLVRRHPHVFGDSQVQDSQEAHTQWDAIKKTERPNSSALGDTPIATPALTFAQVISGRAARAGFEWGRLTDVITKVREELVELEQADGSDELEHEFGDVLFSLVNVARWLGLDAETALRTANRRFSHRFTHMEKSCQEIGTSLGKLSTDERELLWEEAKRLEKSQT